MNPPEGERWGELLGVANPNASLQPSSVWRDQLGAGDRGYCVTPRAFAFGTGGLSSDISAPIHGVLTPLDTKSRPVWSCSRDDSSSSPPCSCCSCRSPPRSPRGPRTRPRPRASSASRRAGRDERISAPEGAQPARVPGEPRRHPHPRGRGQPDRHGAARAARPHRPDRADDARALHHARGGARGRLPHPPAGRGPADRDDRGDRPDEPGRRGARPARRGPGSKRPLPSHHGQATSCGAAALVGDHLAGAAAGAAAAGVVRGCGVGGHRGHGSGSR